AYAAEFARPIQAFVGRDVCVSFIRGCERHFAVERLVADPAGNMRPRNLEAAAAALAALRPPVVIDFWRFALPAPAPVAEEFWLKITPERIARPPPPNPRGH